MNCGTCKTGETARGFTTLTLTRPVTTLVCDQVAAEVFNTGGEPTSTKRSCFDRLTCLAGGVSPRFHAGKLCT
jgi:hypothetical protein